MLDKEALKESARKAFVEKVREKVIFISNDCWASKVENALTELNEIIAAGKEMGVTYTTPMSDPEKKEAVKDLNTLLTLGMKLEARYYVIDLLKSHGIDSDQENPAEMCVLDDLPPVR